MKEWSWIWINQKIVRDLFYTTCKCSIYYNNTKTQSLYGLQQITRIRRRKKKFPMLFHNKLRSVMYNIKICFYIVFFFFFFNHSNITMSNTYNIRWCYIRLESKFFCNSAVMIWAECLGWVYVKSKMVEFAIICRQEYESQISHSEYFFCLFQKNYNAAFSYFFH